MVQSSSTTLPELLIVRMVVRNYTEKVNGRVEAVVPRQKIVVAAKIIANDP